MNNIRTNKILKLKKGLNSKMLLKKTIRFRLMPNNAHVGPEISNHFALQELNCLPNL